MAIMTSRCKPSKETVQLRNRIMQLFRKGMNTMQIADFLNLTEAEVYNQMAWRRFYRAQGRGPKC